MEILERIWDFLSAFASGMLGGVERLITTIFGSSNARYVRRCRQRVDAINALEPKYQEMSEEQLREQTVEFRKRLDAGETLDDLLVEAFAICREAGKRYLNMRHYDVQLIGGMILHEGNIAEMITGEGKTLVATLAAYLNGLSGKGVHVVTVNDYLARRDMEWMGPLHMELGLTVGAIYANMSPDDRQKAYACDITYGTNNEFGFDYLRDNMRNAARDDERYPKSAQQAQGNLNFAIVDEVDNILIDEARTPLIISGPAYDNVRKYAEANRIAKQLKKNTHFEVNEKDHSAHLTDDGVREAERLAGVESFYTAGNMEWPHLLDNSLKAHYLYKNDVNYVVKEGSVIIVDEFTGRLMEGRQWSDGLHQAVEAKEGVTIKEETQTLATITLQNFFKLYNKVCGMTGTAMTEAGEFWNIYGLDVIAVPTNRELQRIESPDAIYRSEREKFGAIADEIEQLNRWDTLETADGEQQIGTVLKEINGRYEFQPRGTKKKTTFDEGDVVAVQRKGRPILVGTVSIEKSERLSDLLKKRGVEHEVLNAKHHKREADIVAQAGRQYAVTIATNMAGRGTDIVLGGNPETMAWAKLQETYSSRLDVPTEEWDQLVDEFRVKENMDDEADIVRGLGGLHIVGTERHEARRIDLQLRGRSGRQGDPGSSRFYLSLEDDLMRIFAGEWVKNVLTRLGMKDGEAIESKMVSRRIEGAQKKVEERNFEIRKNLLEYDEVMDEQRKRVYNYRQEILDGANCKELILEMIREQIDHHLNEFLDRDYGVERFANWAGSRLGVEFEARDFRKMEFVDADRYAKDQAERMAESQILDLIEETLPEEEDPKSWNWESLAKSLNTRWQLGVRDRELKKFGRGGVGDQVIQRARQAVHRIELAEGKRFLESDFGFQVAVAWVKHKFDIELKSDEFKDLELGVFKERVDEEARLAYDRREVEYPIMAGFYHFTRTDGGQKRYDREALVAWARERFEVELSLDDVKSKQREEIHELLLDPSRKAQQQADASHVEASDRIDELFGSMEASDVSLSAVETDEASLEKFCSWCQDELKFELTSEQLSRLERAEIERRVDSAVEERYRPEIRRMERALVLQILDTAWKDHLLAMDHLRSSVGLRGYAQVDPKVEYKREGMRIFDGMWLSMGERVTDLIYRMEQLDEDFVGSTWVETEAKHEQAPSTSEIASGEVESAGTSDDGKIEPIRNRDQRVPRNAPCPCGSGKKFKNCCMRKSVTPS